MGALKDPKLNVEGLLAEFYAAAAMHQPELAVSTTDGLIVLEGRFVVSSSDGPFDVFDIGVAVSASYPLEEPVVFETGGQIPRVADRHIFEDHGVCCLGVWEEWLLRSRDHSPAAFLTGPLHDFFLSQCWFKAKGEWPFGDRSHGKLGILEAYCDLLGIDQNLENALAHLRLLSMRSMKGHNACPCGSGLLLRHCHRAKLEALRTRIPPTMARRMLGKLKR